MPKTFNPSALLPQMTVQMREWVQSLHKTLNGNMDIGVPLKQNPVAGINKNVYTQFDKGNGSGILIRIAAHGVTGTGAKYNWPAVGSLVINHGLDRQPIGFRIEDCDKDVRVFRTASPNSVQITIQPTDVTASVTLYIY